MSLAPEAAGDTGRLPDFVIIGAMKSGTTSLYRWLETLPDVWLPTVKEPHFFSDDRVWAKGIDWYREMFAGAPADQVTGEASASYTDPRAAVTAADRMRSVVPEARLVYLLRQPVDRLRSHYRHEVQRGRERRPFADAVAEADSPYVAMSCYYRCLEPYLERFRPEQILVVRLDDVAEPGPSWARLVAHLGLSAPPEALDPHNVTATKRQFNPIARLLWDRGQLQRLGRLPAPVRRLGRPLLMRGSSRQSELVASANGRLDGDIVEAIRHDLGRLEGLLGQPLWQVTDPAD